MGNEGDEDTELRDVRANSGFKAYFYTGTNGMIHQQVHEFWHQLQLIQLLILPLISAPYQFQILSLL